MTIVEAAFLGMVQGLTEFLPISSSGHLVIVQHWLGCQEAPLTFDVMVHLGTVLAVVAAFWRELWDLIRRPAQRMVLMIIIGAIPTGIIGVLFKPVFEGFFASITVVGVGLLFTGLLLWISDRFSYGSKRIKEMTVSNALLIGAIQGLAITPGISRSGSTIVGGLFTGLNRELAATYSFFLSIPVILGASLLEACDLLTGQFNAEILPIIIGTGVAAITGFLAIKIVMQVVRKGRLSLFSYYCWALGGFILAYQLFF